MTTATAATTQRGLARATYTAAHVQERVRRDLEFCGITRADIAVTRCDDLLNVYVAHVRVSFGPTAEHPMVNTVYLYWRDRHGGEHFRTIVRPWDVTNTYLDVDSVQTDGDEIVVSCRMHCGPGALKSDMLERRVRIAELDL